MKLNGKMMMAVVMVLGSLAVTGCSTASAADTSAVAPEETAATAPVENSANATNGVEKDFFGIRFYAPIAPPAARFEVVLVAPSARHFWAPGYYRWNGREHVWVAGRWELRRDGSRARLAGWWRLPRGSLGWVPMVPRRRSARQCPR
jgi:hypothetical protein